MTELSGMQRAKIADMREKLKSMGDSRADDRDSIIKILEASGSKLFPSKKEDGGKVEISKKYTGPLPLPKPTPIERFTGVRSVNKPTNAEEQERIGNRMAKKFKKSKKAQRYEEGGAVRGMGRAYMGSSRKAKIR